MARKVFLSVLGTGFYENCIYYSDEFSIETRFIQHATLSLLTKQSEWTKEDAVYILLTSKAKTDNWKIPTGKRHNYKEGKDVNYTGLENILKNMAIVTPINPIDINDGKNESEMWEIFSKVYNVLQEGDELYFDITHGFRYLPMFVMVLGNYAKLLKKITVKAVTYGNYEAKNEKGAPIMNLQSLSVLQDWTTSATTFIETGRVRAFTNDVKTLVNNSSIADKFKDATNKSNKRLNKLKEAINLFNKRLNSFEGQISTCRGNDIIKGQAAQDVKKEYDIISKSGVLPQPVLEILKKMNDSVCEYQSDSFDNLKLAIEWCKRYDLVQQGYTICQESIFTYLCDHFSALNPYQDIKYYRDFWGSILGVSKEAKDNETQWKSHLAKNRELTRALFKLEWINNFRTTYDELQKNRNTLNHAGFIGDTQAEEIKNNFHDIVDECMKLFNQDLTSPEIRPCLKRIFINLSNHPYAQWDGEQRKAAEKYGECIDIPFPQIDPEASAKEIDTTVREYIGKIKEHAEGHIVTVHIMGEMCFTYRIIKQLQALGIRCVCSTSYRLVHDEGNGKRYVEFQFKQFRDYECQ